MSEDQPEYLTGRFIPAHEFPGRSRLDEVPRPSREQSEVAWNRLKAVALGESDNLTAEMAGDILIEWTEVFRERDDERKRFDQAETELIMQRDFWEARATDLATVIGDHFGEDFGEHSSFNDPTFNALRFLQNTEPTDR